MYVDPQSRLSLNFRVWEFCNSAFATAHGVDIRVVEDSRIHRNLTGLCHSTLQPVREQVGVIHVSSGYRPAHVNTAVGGVSTSQHCDGAAADVYHDALSAEELAWEFVHAGVPIDQLILEHDQGIVHVSHVRPDIGIGNRGEILTRYRDAAGALQYLTGLVAAEDLP